MDDLETLQARRERDRQRKADARAKAKAEREVASKVHKHRADPNRELKDAAAREARERRRTPVVKEAKPLELPGNIRHTGRWLPKTTITYIPVDGSVRVTEQPTIHTEEFGEIENYLDDLPEAIALDFYRRGAVEPELVPKEN